MVKLFGTIVYKIGLLQMCPDHNLFGFHQKSPGAMASYMIYPEKARVHKVCIRIIINNLSSSCNSKIRNPAPSTIILYISGNLKYPNYQ